MRLDRRGLLLIAAAVWSGGPSAWAQDSVASLSGDLAGARSFKVRIQAAYLLGKLHDPRVLPALTRALSEDKEEVVREFVARLIANNPGGDPAGNNARIALVNALRDRSDKVRRAAKSGLQTLEQNVRRTASTNTRPMPPASGARANKRIKIVVGKMADRSGQASTGQRDRARQEVMGQLRASPSIALQDQVDDDVSYIVDGSIRKLTLLSLRSDVEATCAIDLILSKPSRGILMVASGEASVQRPRGQFRPYQRDGMQSEAITHAVRSAHENLAQFLARQ
ncbi:MAG: HEAT repeat domain-containing protein [Deltaproteobacteria bacterium]|nr:HEAT repeat domain-containing protein [Deltaproteobacteria bacterium]